MTPEVVAEWKFRTREPSSGQQRHALAMAEQQQTALDTCTTTAVILDCISMIFGAAKIHPPVAAAGANSAKSGASEQQSEVILDARQTPADGRQGERQGPDPTNRKGGKVYIQHIFNQKRRRNGDAWGAGTGMGTGTVT